MTPETETTQLTEMTPLTKASPTSDYEIVPWPAEAAERYVAAGHWRGRPLGHWLWEWARRYGPRTAIVDGTRRISYLRLARDADALADHLLRHGLRSGDRILVQLPNTADFITVFFACQRIGVAPILALMAHRENELGHLARWAHAIVVPARWQGFDHGRLAAKVAEAAALKVFVADGDAEDPRPYDDGLIPLTPPETAPGGAEALRRRLDEAAPDSRRLALLLLSGGTTGLSKLVPRTHDDYEYNARRSAEVCGFGPDTVYLVALPAAHNFPLGSPGILGTLMNGGRVVLTRSPRPEVAFPLIERERVTVTSLVPAIAQRWADAATTAPHDLGCLRMVQLGGSVLAPEQAERIAAGLRCPVQQVYGMAEGLLNYTRPGDPPEVLRTTQGRPISPDDEIRIVDDRGEPVPAGGAGELQTRGPYTIRGYFGTSEHDAAAFTPDGWYRTGDVVRLHPSGNLIVAGRIKDIVNRGGEKISAAEIETAVQALPQVRQAAVIPVPDPELGERACVCVVLHPKTTLTLEELQETFRRDGVAKYRIPERLEVFPILPMTPIGKVDKKRLRVLVAERATADDRPEPARI